MISVTAVSLARVSTMNLEFLSAIQTNLVFQIANSNVKDKTNEEKSYLTKQLLLVCWILVEVLVDRCYHCGGVDTTNVTV